MSWTSFKDNKKLLFKNSASSISTKGLKLSRMFVIPIPYVYGWYFQFELHTYKGGQLGLNFILQYTLLIGTLILIDLEHIHPALIGQKYLE